MGQIEVYELLKERRNNKDNNYYSNTDVSKMMKAKGCSNGMIENVRANLISLESSGYLEIKMSGKIRDWKRLYRIKAVYLEKKR